MRLAPFAHCHQCTVRHGLRMCLDTHGRKVFTCPKHDTGKRIPRPERPRGGERHV